jgi:transposase
MAKSKKNRAAHQPLKPGLVARNSEFTLRSFEVGALPIINSILGRMRLSEILRETLPADDPRVQLPTHRVLVLLVRNILVSREPIYGVGQWAAGYAPDLLDLFHHEVELLNDDRAGRCLDRLRDALDSGLIMKVVRHVIDEFGVQLIELHNDSTSLALFGAYRGDEQSRWERGRKTLAITHGHSKDHRPDLKQLLYILTVSDDGGVPLYFTAADGNTTDDVTHRATWDLLHELVGRSDFLYVADCKLATRDNMNYIDGRNGRFITVLPRSRKEDKDFRARLLSKPHSVHWKDVYTLTKVTRLRGQEVIETVDRFTVCSDKMLSQEGYRLLWYHSTRKAELDAQRRAERLRRATQELWALRDRLQGPKTRLTQREKVQQEVQEILQERDVEGLLAVEILEHDKEEYKQVTRGRPGKNTKYVKTVKKRFDLSWNVDVRQQQEAEATDGVFPLVSNDKEMTEEEILRAYKRQPVIEKRFSQLKTDFAVAPVYLKSVTRIHGLLAVYFFALMAQTLLERELRQAMHRRRIKSLRLYPEGRPCYRPTTRKVIDLFSGCQRHELKSSGCETQIVTTRLSPVQKQVVELLGLSPRGYGR